MSDKKSNEAVGTLGKTGELIALLQERDRMLRKALAMLDKKNSEIIEDEINRNNDLLTSSVNVERVIQNNGDWKKSYKLLAAVVDKNSNNLSTFKEALGDKPQTKSLLEKFSGFWKACAQSIASAFTSPKIDLSNLQKQNEGLESTLDVYVAAHPKQRDAQEPSAKTSDTPSATLFPDAAPSPAQPATAHRIPPPPPPPRTKEASKASAPLEAKPKAPPPPPPPPPRRLGTAQKTSSDTPPLISPNHVNEGRKVPEVRQQTTQETDLFASIQKGTNLRNADAQKASQSLSNDPMNKVTARRAAIAGEDNEDREQPPKKLTPREEMLEASKKAERWQEERAKIETERMSPVITQPREPETNTNKDRIIDQSGAPSLIPKAPPPPPPPPSGQGASKQSWVERTGSKPKIAQHSNETESSLNNQGVFNTSALEKARERNAAPSNDKDMQKYGLATKPENKAAALSTALSKGRASLFEDLMNPRGNSQLPQDVDKFIKAVTKSTEEKMTEIADWGESPKKAAFEAFKAVPIEKWREIQSAKVISSSVAR